MKTAREVATEAVMKAHRVKGTSMGVTPVSLTDIVTDVTAAIEQVQRETVEAAERAIGKLPVVGIATAPYIAALVAARRAVLALSPKGGPSDGDAT